MKKTLLSTVAFIFIGILFSPFAGAQISDPRETAKNIDVSKYASIQDAIDANPNRIISLPSETYTISNSIKLRSDNSGLCGNATIIQTNQNEPIIHVANSKNVKIGGLNLIRKISDMPVRADAIKVERCENLSLDNIKISNNKSPGAGIRLHNSKNASVTNCSIENYMCISVDDRTVGNNYGYAFNCIDGNGIIITECKNILISQNSIVEHDLRPTREIQKKFKLGDFTKMNAKKGLLVSQKTWDEKWVSNWHQGSAIFVGSPSKTSRVQILGNRIQNAAQGVDIHAENVIMAHNIVENSFVGMKAMHGSRCIVITSNQFIKNDLWAIGVMPGAASHSASAEKEANDDGSAIISNNIISQLGEGDSAWIWGNGGRAIFVDIGQTDENPPISDVVISGNIVHCADEKNPKFAYSLLIHQGTRTRAAPKNILVASDNIFKKGTKGIDNFSNKRK